jgi:hypothetical protein
MAAADTTNDNFLKRMHDSSTLAVPELQTTINIVSLMVDVNGTLMDRSIDVAAVDTGTATGTATGTGTVSESVFLGIMHAQRHQRPDKRRFQLADMVTFFVPVKTPLESLDQSQLLTTLPAIPKDIVVPSCLFVFHSINCIWLIFREEVPKTTTSSTGTTPPHLAISILKASNTKSNKKKHVRISQELPRYKTLLPKRKTIKIHYD